MKNIDRTKLTNLASEALEAARIEVVRRMNSRGHSLTLINRILSIPNDPDSAGWRTEVVTEQVSGLYPDEIVSDIRDTSVDNFILGLKEQLLPLAQYLAENTIQAVGRYSNLIGDDKVDGLLFRCVSPMALHYLQSLTDLASGEPELVARLSEELYEMAHSNSITHINHLAVSGVSPDERYSHRGVSVRPLTGRERGNWSAYTVMAQRRRPAPNSDFHPFGPFPSMFLPSTLIEISTTRPLNEQYDTSRLPYKVALSFYLAGYNLGGSGTITHFDSPTWASLGRNSTPFPVNEKTAPISAALTNDEFMGIVDLAYKIPDFGGEESGGRDVVLYRVLRGCGLLWLESSFLDFAIALEAALLQNSTTELSYRFGLYGALFLREELDPQETFKRLRNIYTVRSKIVHGGTISPQMRNNANRDAAELACAVTRKAIETRWPDSKTLDTIALSFFSKS